MKHATTKRPTRVFWGWHAPRHDRPIPFRTAMLCWVGAAMVVTSTAVAAVEVLA